MLAASFQEASATSKPIMDHYGQQRYWKCVDLQLHGWRGDEGDCAISSNDWQWHLNFRTSKCAFLMMYMGVTWEIQKPFASCDFLYLDENVYPLPPGPTAELADVEMAFF